MDIFSTGETAVITALTPLLSDGVRTLEAFTGVLDVNTVQEMVNRLPSIYVSFPKMVNDPENQLDRMSMNFRIAICDRNMKGNNETRAAIYALSQKVMLLLHREQIIGAGWNTAVLKGAYLIGWEEKFKIMVFGHDYETKTFS